MAKFKKSLFHTSLCVTLESVSPSAMEEKFLSTELDILTVVSLAWTTSIDEEYQIVGYDQDLISWPKLSRCFDGFVMTARATELIYATKPRFKSIIITV